MSNASSKSTSSEASDSRRQNNQNQPLDVVLTAEQESGIEKSRKLITGSAIREVDTSKESGIEKDLPTSTVETASIVNFPDSAHTYIPLKRALGDDTDTSIQGSEINREDEDNHNLAVVTAEEEGVSKAVLVFPSIHKSLDEEASAIVRESVPKNRLIERLRLELTEKCQHESKLEENIDYFREKTEKLEQQLHDIEVETFQTREHQLKVKEDEVKVAKSQLVAVEKQNKEEKQKLKALEYQRIHLKSTVSKLQDDHKKKEIERRELILHFKEKLNHQQELELQRFKELCELKVKYVQAEAMITKQKVRLTGENLARAQQLKKELEDENQQLKLKQLHESKQEFGFDGDMTNSVPIVEEAETTKGGFQASAVNFPDTDTTVQGGGLDGQDKDLTVDTFREQEESISEAIEEVKCHQKQEMVLTLPASQKSGAKSLDSGDPIKTSIDIILHENKRKNTLITNLKVELATFQYHDSKLQEEVAHLREEHEKLEHQLIDKEEETNRTREDYQNEIAILESLLKGNIHEVKKAKMQLSIAEKQNQDEKQKLEDRIKTFEDQRLELESTVSKLQNDHKKKDIKSKELIVSLKETLNDQQALENKRFKELCDTQVKLAQAVAEIAKQEALLKDKDLALVRENQKKLESENQQLKQQHISSQTKIEDEEQEQFKELYETKEKLEAQVQIAEKHLLFAQEGKKMFELSIQSWILDSASSMTSGVESMDEQSEFDPDRKAELEVMDTFTGQIDVSNKSSDKTPEQEILWLNNMLAECISANTLLMKENIQFKKTNNNLEQEIARLKSEKVKEEQLNPETIKEEPTSGNDHQLLSSTLKHIKQETKAEPQTTDVKSEEPVSQLLPLGLSTVQHHAIPFNLPGVEVVANTCVIITNSPQTFHWVGYGFKLTIPQGSLPAGVDQCRLDIKASVAGQYQFPDNLQLVSSVFWMRPYPSGQFQQQLTVEIQHCAKMTSSTKLSFVRAHCSQESLPYTFKQLEGRGSFTVYSSYGSLELNHFSGLAVTGEDVERGYIASLYYQQCDPRTLEIHFVITWDVEAHITATKDYFKELGAKERSHLEVEFKKDKIILDIPMAGGVTIGEWNLLPTVTPCIRQSRVDSFKPGRKIRSRRLKATLTRDLGVEVPACSYLVTLDGADEPNQMQIEIDTYIPNKERRRVTSVFTVPSVSQVPSSQAGEDNERDENQLCIDDLQDVFSLLINAKKSWFYLGLALHIKPGILEGIKSKESCNTDRLCEMLTHWLRSSSSRTWSDICKGLRSDTVKQDVLADKIKEKYKGLSRKKLRTSSM